MHLLNKTLTSLLLYHIFLTNHACCVKNVVLEYTAITNKLDDNIEHTDAILHVRNKRENDHLKPNTEEPPHLSNKNKVIIPETMPLILNTTLSKNKINDPSAVDPVNSNEHVEQNKNTIKKDLGNLASIASHYNDSVVKITEVKPVPSIVKNITLTEHPPNITAAASDKDVHPPTIKPGAKKRGIIVFGSLTLFAIIYLAYKIYRRRNLARDGDGSFYQNDLQQFKYGVLKSNETDHLEMSNLPLTAESEDEEEMEIFDLERRKYLDRNEVKNIQVTNQLLAKDDVEILDLDLPGSSNTDIQQQLIRDDDLLDLVDRMNIPTVTVVQNKGDDKPSKNNTNDFFDVL